MATGTAARLVDHYLQLCEDRDLDEAARLLAPGVRLVFPGDLVFTSLSEMVAGAGGRYLWVRKNRERYFEGDGDDAVVVTSLGTLYGEDLAGAPFSGIRYVDVFVIRDGLIAEQHVYNDLSEAGFPLPGLTPPTPSV
ncbi:nuclear transport factor 2 family protein [Streptosporangium sp. NPDC006013]|uniref:nuclear transport factor 2 family protein n=1 Tax=Streptosporangium sp. NPDC006013 TaxID=3155596 RepID=UPI0033B1F5FB